VFIINEVLLALERFSVIEKKEQFLLYYLIRRITFLFFIFYLSTFKMKLEYVKVNIELEGFNFLEVNIELGMKGR
jgi:hypothetical protein